MATPAGEALRLRAVGEIKDAFKVPPYQRGYRWGDLEVGQLLDDIWERRDKPYYLQPVVVKRDGESWELIDGQQRLTTLFLIFQYMQDSGFQKEGAGYTLEYETRTGSADYLRKLDPAEKETSIDFFHMFMAYECIKRWFDDRAEPSQDVADSLHEALSQRVKVIWYEAPSHLEANELFRRLNAGRIPLTGAELVKATLMSSESNQHLEFAAQWDAFERDLRNREVWAFATGKAELDPTNIDLLLGSVADRIAAKKRAARPRDDERRTHRDRTSLDTFNALRKEISSGPRDFWDKVVEGHAFALGCYRDPDAFHKIGFLIAERQTSFGELMVEADGMTKTEFKDSLTVRIRRSLNVSKGTLGDLDYQTQKAKTGRVLFLVNVETIRGRGNSFERYSFRKHAEGRWSLEHIHAQSAERIQRTQAAWREWLRLQSEVLETFDMEESLKRSLLDRTWGALDSSDMTETEFRDLAYEFSNLLSPEADPTDSQTDSSDNDMHLISNLALLDSGANSALSNSVFAVKRSRILRMDRDGGFIPVATRNVFLKYYSFTQGDSRADEMHFWSATDRTLYLGAITELLAPYLLDDERAAS